MFMKLFEMKTPPFETVERLWKGSIDMHIHPAPDPGTVRRVDSLEAAMAAQEADMRAIVLKSDFFPTTPLAKVARHVAPNVEVFGSLNIEYGTTGALTYAAEILETNAKLGCKVLWFPTFDAQYCRQAIGRKGGIYILDANGKLLPEVPEILKIVKKYNIVLCSGHLSYAETLALFEEAIKQGIDKMVATHPLSDVAWAPMTMDQMKHLASMGVYIEHCFRNCMPLLGSYDPMNYVEAIREIGAEHTIMCTDYAQVTDTTPAEGMRMFIGMMLQLGISEEEVELMVKVNPAKLLDLDKAG